MLADPWGIGPTGVASPDDLPADHQPAREADAPSATRRDLLLRRNTDGRTATFGAPGRGIAAAVVALILAAGAGVTTGAPATIADKRAEVARITEELEAIDHRVEDAAEAYNGARYRLAETTQRVTRNRRALTSTTRQLAAKRSVLAQRLRGIYATPEPSLAQVLVTSGSLTAVIEQVDLLERVGDSDARLVGSLRASRERLAVLRRGLISDREKSRREVGEARRQTQAVEALLAQRRIVLDSAQGELGRLLAAERARERRDAAARAQIARQRQAATAATVTSPATTATPRRLRRRSPRPRIRRRPPPRSPCRAERATRPRQASR